MTQLSSKWLKMSRKQVYVYFYASNCYKINQNIIRTFFSWKSGYRTKKIFLQLWYSLSQGTSSQDIQSQVETDRVKLGHVKSSQSWLSLVRTGQVNLEQVKSSQVGTGQVKLGQVKSSLKPNNSWAHKISWPKICFYPKFCGSQSFVGLKIIFNPNSFLPNIFWTLIFWIQIFST